MANPPAQPPHIVSAEFAAAARQPAEVPPPVGIEVAFAGRSNVGKSSLMNALMGRRNLVRTSSTPGCTRQLTFFGARMKGGLELTLVDLPGYGYARRSKAERNAWGELIEGYLLGRPTLRAVVVLVDARRGVEADDRDLFELLAAEPRTSRPPLATILVATKLDKLPSAARKPALAKLGRDAGRPVVGFSTRDGEAPVRLWRKLMSALELA